MFFTYVCSIKINFFFFKNLTFFFSKSQKSHKLIFFAKLGEAMVYVAMDLFGQLYVYTKYIDKEHLIMFTFNTSSLTGPKSTMVSERVHAKAIQV